MLSPSAFLANPLSQIIFTLRECLWSGPLLCLLIGVGILQTWRTRAVQWQLLKYWGHCIRAYFCKSQSPNGPSAHEGDLSAFQALMTALAGAIGTGNITGIAAAVATGGFGALFWMWVVAFFGMATAFSETVLSVKYRQKNANGEIIGGPMVILSQRLKQHKLASAFAVFGAIAGLGYGMVQSNSVVDAITTLFPYDRFYLGLTLTAIAGYIIIGGISRIAQAASALVPFMAIVYLSISLVVLITHAAALPNAFKLIINSAFTGQAAIGGFVGSTLMLALQNGTQYGIFANEAGLGSFAIASAGAKTDTAIHQGFLSMTGVFVATLIICTITGLVLAVTNVLGTIENGQVLSGSPLALLAFKSVHSSFPYCVLLCLTLFALTTMLAWSYYGEKCTEFLFNTQAAYKYRWLYVACLLLGVMIKLDLVWAFAHLANGCMAIPNLIAIVLLSKELQADLTAHFTPLRSCSMQIKQRGHIVSD